MIVIISTGDLAKIRRLKDGFKYYSVFLLIR